MDTKTLRLGVIGLGAMGAEMLDVALAHPDVEVVLAADPSEQALDRVRGAHPNRDLTLTRDADDVLDPAKVDAVYIAAPPVTHAGYAVRAMKAGLAVFCEKPLAVSLEDGAEMVAVAEATGAVNALNYTFSDRAGAVEVVRAVRAGEAGTVRGVTMRFAFPEWPRAFQRDAAWLNGRQQGGFLREVASHFLFLTDRVLGPLDVVRTAVTYGDGAEVAAMGLLTAGDIPVELSGMVAAGPETYEWTLHGSERSYRITGFGDLSIGDATGWHPQELPGHRGTEHSRLGEFAAAVHGEPSTLADFAAGLRVQRVVEGFHG